LGAVYAGAHGETAREISETMHLIVRQEDVPTAFASLRAPLAVWAAWDARAHPPSQLWHHQGIEYLESFKKVLRDSYATKIASLDYSDLEHAAQAVNDWNISQTRGSTLRLASAGDFNDVNRLLITNAVHFNRKWSEPFRQKATHLERFAAPGTPVEVAMMHLAASRCRYATVDGVQILEKPYGDGDLSMLILLPPAGEKGLAELEGSLTEVILMKFLAATADNKVEVFLPRFKVESVFNLRQHLEALGMRLPFDAQAADLSGISERQKLALGPVIHKAFVEVDEEGPPTDPGRQPSFGAAEEPSPDQPVFRADHPFVFLIRDNHTGAIVFIGRLVTPGP
jgi:serpin B